MRKRDISNVAVPLATALAIPLIMLGTWSLGGRIPPEALAVMAGVYVMGLAWIAISFDSEKRQKRRAAMSVETEAGAIAVQPGLEPVYSLPAISAPRVVTVIGAVGLCPRGLKIADQISVGADGRMSFAMCQTSVERLLPLLSQGTDDQKFIPQTRCICPIPGRSLTFEVRPADSVGAG